MIGTFTFTLKLNLTDYVLLLKFNSRLLPLIQDS